MVLPVNRYRLLALSPAVIPYDLMRLAILLLLCVTSSWSQIRKTVLMITDAEGVAGVCRQDQTDPKNSELRQLLTGEINAAVDGFLGGGADEVVVWDGHDGSQTLSALTIHPKAKLLMGALGPGMTMERGYVAVAFVGQHGRANSRGGVMALLTAIEFPETASVVTWGGVSDMSLTYMERKDLRRMMKRVIGGTPQKYPERYQDRTPLYSLEKLTAPVLIIHGAKDGNVSVEHAYRLERTLRLLEKPVEAWYFNEFTHYFPPVVNRKVVNDLTKWMKSHRKR